MVAEKLLVGKRVDGPSDGSHASLAPPFHDVGGQFVFVHRHDGETDEMPQDAVKEPRMYDVEGCSQSRDESVTVFQGSVQVERVDQGSPGGFHSKAYAVCA